MINLPKVFDANADTLLELEQAVADKATQPFIKPFKRVLALLYALWPGDQADPLEKKRAFSNINVSTILVPLSEVERTILVEAIAALTQGIEAGKSMASAVGVDVTGAFKQPSTEELVTQVQVMRERVLAQHAQVTRLLADIQTLDEATSVLALADPRSRVERTTRYITNHASNLGIKAVANASPDLVLIWVAERDACVHCLAYQGHKRARGGYPAGLTYGKKPLTFHKKRVPEPPLHPNCRCTQWVLHRESAEDVQRSLLREAQRSILRGWAVESESQSVRVDAARRLLAKHPAMPKSVQVYARKAVKAGVFARGRVFPGKR